MISESFIWVALAVTIAGNIAYVVDTLKGETKPNRITFLLWGLSPLITYFAQRQEGGSAQIWYTLIIAVMPISILAASFVNKKAYWKITRFDIGCGAIAVVALICLLATDNALLALVLSIFADFWAALPTIIKAHKYPETETIWAYASEIVGSLIVLLTLQSWIFVDYSFALYILFMNVLFTLLIASGNRRRRRTVIT